MTQRQDEVPTRAPAPPAGTAEMLPQTSGPGIEEGTGGLSDAPRTGTVPQGGEGARRLWRRRGAKLAPGSAARGGRRTIDELLAEARGQIDRLEPRAAFEAVEQGALLIDIRQDTNRLRDGIIPGSLHVPRTVLEWRVDLDSTSRNPHVGGLDRHVIVVCDHGYSSSLAAATLLRLGFGRATDLVGGFVGWRDAGLPTRPLTQLRSEPGMLSGMGPPDP